jgi:hypothetical protein
MDVMDLLTLKDFSSKDRKTLNMLDEFLSELRDAFESLTNDESNEIWRHENGDAMRTERVSDAFSLAMDPKDQ